MSLFLLLAACQHQYLAIPGATPVPVDEVDLSPTDPTSPTWTISAGELPDELDESVTIDIPLDGAWSFEVTEIVFTVWQTATLSYAEYWVYEIQESERAAGVVSVIIQVLSSPPSEQACSRWHVGTRVCFGRVDEGIATTSFFLTDDDGTGSLGGEVPITLAPLDDVGGGDPGECLTFDECCADVPGYDVLACPVEASCDCPAGTVDDGVKTDGFRQCLCPA
ncbi:MAG: hypothetical protein Q8P41_20570 [Pseudomonadota bacterium]|nr:hypothetical protein [Pseudomonadota bacterium]